MCHIIYIYIIYLYSKCAGICSVRVNIYRTWMCSFLWGVFLQLLLLSQTRWDCLPWPILEVVLVVLGVSTLPFKHKNPLEHCLHRGIRSNQTKMTSLSIKDKDKVRAFWTKIASSKEEIGANALCRCVWDPLDALDGLTLTHSVIMFFFLLATQDALSVPADQDLLLSLEGPEP